MSDPYATIARPAAPDPYATVARPAPRSGNAFEGASASGSRRPPRNAAQRVYGAGSAVGQGVLDSAVGIGQLGSESGRAGVGIRLAAGVLDAAGQTRGARIVRRLADGVDPSTAAAAQVPRYQPQGALERNLEVTGRAIPNALMPGGMVARGLSVALPVVGHMVGQSVGGDTGGAVGEFAGNVATGLRLPTRAPAPTAAARAARTLRRGGPSAVDSAAMRARQAESAAAGVDATLTDLTDASGRRIIRAAASRPGPGEQVARDYNTARNADLPTQISRHARRIVSPGLEVPDGNGGTRTITAPDQMVEHLTQTRDAQAATDYAPAYETQVPVTPELGAVLQDEAGRTALRAARADAVWRRDAQRVAELDALLNSDPALPMDNASRMARAAEQGFTTDAYHGTSRDFSELQLTTEPSTRSSFGREGVFTTPQTSTANRYAAFDGGDGANVRPVLLREKQPLSLSGPQYWRLQRVTNALRDGRQPSEVERVFLEDDLSQATGRPFPPGADPMVWLREQGYTTIHRPADGVGRRGGAEAESLTFDPSNIRSRFDPFGPEGYRPPPPTVSAATLDRSQIALRERGNKLTRAGNRARASGALSRRDVVNNALDNVPALSEARAAYRDMSGRIDAVDTGSGFYGANPDTFSADVANMNPMQRQVARAAAARSIELASGGRSNALTAADTLSKGPNQMAVNNALLGPQDAETLGNAMRLEAQRVRNAQDINPRAGSQTHMNFGGENALNNAVEAGQAAMELGAASHGSFPAAMALVRRVGGRLTGLSDADALNLVQMATSNDPATINAVIAEVDRLSGQPGAGLRLIQSINRIRLPGAIGGVTAATASQSAQQGQ